jgi:hypothetical protein
MKMRRSKQREAILRAVRQTTCHPTAEWVYAQVKKEIPGISLGTVYRNLRFLSETSDVLAQVSARGRQFDGCTETITTFVGGCGAVLDVTCRRLRPGTNCGGAHGPPSGGPCSNSGGYGGESARVQTRHSRGAVPHGNSRLRRIDFHGVFTAGEQYDIAVGSSGMSGGLLRNSVTVTRTGASRTVQPTVGHVTSSR